MLFQIATITIYSFVALAAVVMTLLEGWSHRKPWTAMRILGLFACLVWPLTLVIFLVYIIVSKARQALSQSVEHPAAKIGR